MKLKIFAYLMVLSSFAWGQEFALEEEVVVTGIYGDSQEPPGIVYKRVADNLLLRVQVINDSRDEQTRRKEIYKTLENAVSLAEKNDNISISYEIAGGFIAPLTKSNLEVELYKGERPDTNATDVLVKVAIDEKKTAGNQLLEDLMKFVSKIPVEGRTELVEEDDVSISVVNPSQYRSKIVALIAEDIKNVTGALGGDYHVAIQGLSGPVEWQRSGALNVALYIFYDYQVIPKGTQLNLLPEY